MTPEIEKVLDDLPGKICRGELTPNEAMLVLVYLNNCIIENIFEGV